MAVYAHSLPGTPPSDWELLDAHLEAVAGRAAIFAETFGAGDWGRAAGLLHDLGKAKPEFQAYLLGERGSEPHSAEGARFAVEHYPMRSRKAFDAPLGRLLAFAIAGHHAGLANGRAHGGGTLPLVERLEAACVIEPWFDLDRLPVFHAMPSPLLAAKQPDGSADPFGWAFFVRMLFSALVDADFLETERWYARANNEIVERGWNGALEQLATALDRHLSLFAAPELGNGTAADLALLRAEVLHDCRLASQRTPGLYSLTVPTGGGRRQ